MVAKEGFGWTSASFRIGLSFLSEHMRRAVALCTSPEVFFKGHRTTAVVGNVAEKLEKLNVQAKGAE